MARTKWTNALVEARIRKAVRLLGVVTMPTAPQLRSLDMHWGNALACKIARSGGFDAWGRRLGLARAQHASRKGWRWEVWLRDQARARGLKVIEAPRVKHPWDLRIQGVRVDVKCSRQGKWGAYNGWSFWLGKVRPTCDVYALICLVNGKCARLYFVPAKRLQQTSVTISEKAKRFAELRDDWGAFDGS